MRQDKCAVFQIANNDGTVRLICVPGATFGDGARFEAELREYGGGCLHVSFLGRFDQIQSAADLGELLGLLLDKTAPLLRAS